MESIECGYQFSAPDGSAGDQCSNPARFAITSGGTTPGTANACVNHVHDMSGEVVLDVKRVPHPPVNIAYDARVRTVTSQANAYDPAQFGTVKMARDYASIGVAWDNGDTTLTSADYLVNTLVPEPADDTEGGE